MTDRLTPQREAEIAELRDELAKLIRWHQEDGKSFAKMRATNARLRAELAAVRAERDKARQDAELQRADYFNEAARLLEDAGRDDDAVNLLDIVADGIRTHAPTEGGAR